MSPRTGRPTDGRKEFDIKVRVNAEMHEQILEMAREKGITKAELIRQALREYLPDYKK